jgi:hypothetical protein
MCHGNKDGDGDGWLLGRGVAGRARRGADEIGALSIGAKTG